MKLQISVSTQGALLDGTAPKVIQAGLDRFVTQATLFLLTEVQKRTPQGVFGAQGGLLGSIQDQVYNKGTPIVKGVVMSAQKYAEVIEKGRRPGKGLASAVPGDKYVSPLIPWVNKKLGLSGKDAERVAYLIGRKIKAEGFEGRHMFEKAANENIGRLEAMAQACGLTIARELSE
ncbi:MAG TPA: hypothetical protein HPP94_08650 [Desulfuromonadales bacterium]|nr:hypothetical protein [Desulfuromonadales bacterium]